MYRWEAVKVNTVTVISLVSFFLHCDASNLVLGNSKEKMTNSGGGQLALASHTPNCGDSSPRVGNSKEK